MKAIYREFVASGSVDTQLPGPSSVSFKLDLPRRENPRRFLHNATLSAYSRYSTTGQGNARGGVLALSASGLYPGDKCGHYLNDHITEDEQILLSVYDVDGAKLATGPDCHAFPGELIDDVEHAELAAVVDPVPDEITGPDMVEPESDLFANRVGIAVRTTGDRRHGKVLTA